MRANETDKIPLTIISDQCGTHLLLCLGDCQAGLLSTRRPWRCRAGQ